MDEMQSFNPGQFNGLIQPAKTGKALAILAYILHADVSFRLKGGIK